MPNRKLIKSPERLLLENTELKAKLASVQVELDNIKKAKGISELKQRQLKLQAKLRKRTLEIKEINRSLRDDIIEFKRTKDALEESSKQLSSVYNSMSDGLAVHHIVYNDKGNAVDYIIDDVNPSYEKITGLNKSEITGKKATEVYVVEKAPYIDIYSDVVSSGNPKSFETYFPPMRKHFHVSVFSPGEGKFATIFQDITERKRSEEELAFQAQLLSDVNDSVFSSDSNYVITYWNKAADKMFGWTKEEALGKNSGELLKPKIEGSTRDQERSKLRLAGHWEGELQYIRKDGIYISAEVNSTVLKDTYGKDIGNVIVSRDITERKRSEEALKKSEALYRAIGESIDYGIWICDADGKNTYASESYLKLVGLTQEQCSEFGWGDTLHPDDADRTIAAWKECAKTGTKWDIEHRFRGVDGKWHPILARGIPIRDDKGRIIMWAGINLDISKIKETEDALRQSEENLRESEERFRNLVKNAPTAIYEIDFMKRKFTSVNDSMCKLSGYSREELLSRDPTDLLMDDSKKLFLARISGFSEGELSDENVEYEVKAKDGRIIDAVLNMKFNYNNQGIPVGALVVGHDITERKKADLKLKESEDRFRTIAESLTVMISICRIEDFSLSFINDPFEKKFGLNRGDLSDKKLSDIFYYPDDKMYLNDILKVKGFIENMEIRVTKRDGTPFWIMLSLKKINFMNEPCYLAASIDITETKNAQEELLKLNRTLNANSKSSQAMMHAKDELSYLNKVCQIIIEDCGYNMVWIGYAENDKQKSVRPVAFYGFDQGYIDQMEITWDDTPRGRGPTGTAIRTGNYSLCRNMLTDPAFEPWKKAAIERGYSSSLVLPLKSDGKTFGAISIYSNETDQFSESEINLLTELANDLSYGISFIRLTEAEREATRIIKESESKLKDLVATKDKFFNIVAHDLKNPFTSLLGASELLYENISQMSTANVRKLALILNDSAKGGYAILQNLLDWSRSETGLLKFNPERLNLKMLIDENIENLQLQVTNKEINLMSVLKEDLFILADKNMLNTVLRNLMSNAVKYTYKNGTILVKASQNPEEIIITVKDSGIGIQKEKVDTLFRIDNSISLPGTEKEQGTGLGLKLCKEFTERMGGRIWVESDFGQGSEFKFTIPVNKS